MAARMQRKRLVQSGTHRYAAILEEAVLRQGIGDAEVMAGQLGYLLEATVGDHTPHGCAAALRASVDLYRHLRGDTSALERRTSAETASLDYLAQIEARLPAIGYR